MAYFKLFILFLFLFLSIIFSLGKGSKLIAGLNNSKKKHIYEQEKRINKIMAISMFILTSLTLLYIIIGEKFWIIYFVISAIILFPTVYFINKDKE